jgi:type IV secretion system protein VirB11
LAATLPAGERIQFVGPPVTRSHWAMAVRRHVAIDAVIEDYLPPPGQTPEPAAAAIDPVSDPAGFLRSAVLARKTILISGGTSSGKTTFLNALLKMAPAGDRIITVEDTAEVSISQPNTLGLVAVKGDLGEARVGVEDLLESCLRLRPDRIIVGEVRGPEAATFLRAVNTGHPGSITTVHANSPDGALEQLALMVLQSGMALSRDDTRAYCRSVIDIIVQLARVGGIRQIVGIKSLKA